MPSDARSNLTIDYPELPPSENRIRQLRKFKKGGKSIHAICYTAEAEAYRRKFLQVMGDQYFAEIQKFLAQHKLNSTYRLVILLHFPADQILNKGWVQAKRTVQTPYKKMDAGNRRKLLEDCLAEALSIDDSFFFDTEQIKCVTAGPPKVVLTLETEDPRLFGIPEGYLHVEGP